MLLEIQTVSIKVEWNVDQIFHGIINQSTKQNQQGTFLISIWEKLLIQLYNFYFERWKLRSRKPINSMLCLLKRKRKVRRVSVNCILSIVVAFIAQTTNEKWTNLDFIIYKFDHNVCGTFMKYVIRKRMHLKRSRTRVHCNLSLIGDGGTLNDSKGTLNDWKQTSSTTTNLDKSVYLIRKIFRRTGKTFFFRPPF